MDDGDRSMALEEEGEGAEGTLGFLANSDSTGASRSIGGRSIEELGALGEASTGRGREHGRQTECPHAREVGSRTRQLHERQVKRARTCGTRVERGSSECWTGVEVPEWMDGGGVGEGEGDCREEGRWCIGWLLHVVDVTPLATDPFVSHPLSLLSPDASPSAPTAPSLVDSTETILRASSRLRCALAFPPDNPASSSLSQCLSGSMCRERRVGDAFGEVDLAFDAELELALRRRVCIEGGGELDLSCIGAEARGEVLEEVVDRVWWKTGGFEEGEGAPGLVREIGCLEPVVVGASTVLGALGSDAVVE